MPYVISGDSDDMEWNRTRRIVWMVVLCLGALLMAAQASSGCEAWNTEDYFRAATVEGVRGCLEAGADPKERNGWGVTPLHRAAASNADPAVIQALLVAGANPDARVGDNETPLHRAAASNANPAVIQALLAAGADVHARSRMSVTPLHRAAASNTNPAVIQALLAAGADPNAREYDKETPLHWAARYNEDPAVTRALLAAGADVHAWGWSITPLHQAAEFNENPAVLQALLAAGADPNARDGDNETPLSEVSGNNPNPEVFEALMRDGATGRVRKAWSITPLHRAAGNNENPMVIQALLAAGADPQALDAWKSTPLRWARLRNNVAVIDFLLSNRKPPILSAQDCRMWNTDVFFRTATVHHVQACLAAGADPNVGGQSKQTPLHRAAKFSENPVVVEVLLEAGADPKARDADGKTALHWAAPNEDVVVIEVLLAAGADPNAQSDNGSDHITPLHEAKDPAVIEALLAAGADPNARTNWGNSAPLHLARSAAAVRALLAAGADLEAATKGGATPLYVAVGDGNLEVIRALLKAGANPLSEIWRGDFRTPLAVAEGSESFQSGLRGAVVEELLQEAVKAAGQDCKLWNTKRYFQAATAESVTACMEAGANPNARDSYNNTPMHFVVMLSPDPAVFRVLLEAGADIEAQDKHGSTPLHDAFYGNTDPAVLQALLEAGADVEARDDRGGTPLHHALLSASEAHNRQLKGSYYTAMIQMLLDAGSDVEAKYEFFQGRTALQMAAEYYDDGLPEAILDALLEAAAEQNGPASVEEVSEIIAGMEFVWVPAGEFLMGSTSPEADEWERPLTRVRISEGFWLGKYEVTQDQWLGVMRTNISASSDCGQCPVGRVSWDDAQEFINRLNAQAGGSRYRLPTEAEWEYAARAGTPEDRYGELDAISWCGTDNSGRGTHPVGQKAPNAWGLYDMLGNVDEWVQDWLGDYPGSTVTDPQGTASQPGVRGGSWKSYRTQQCRVANRNRYWHSHRRTHVGFRLLRTE